MSNQPESDRAKRGALSLHGVNAGASRANLVNIGRNGWLWNEDPNNPTFTPSVIAQGIYRCHSLVRNGKIEFLPDSTHGLRGMTVDLPNWPFSEESDLMEMAKNGQQP